MAGIHQAKKDGEALDIKGFWISNKFRIRAESNSRFGAIMFFLAPKVARSLKILEY
jgi:hypothetical protein